MPGDQGGLSHIRLSFSSSRHAVQVWCLASLSRTAPEATSWTPRVQVLRKLGPTGLSRNLSPQPAPQRPLPGGAARTAAHQPPGDGPTAETTVAAAAAAATEPTSGCIGLQRTTAAHHRARPQRRSALSAAGCPPCRPAALGAGFTRLLPSALAIFSNYAVHRLLLRISSLDDSRSWLLPHGLSPTVALAWGPKPSHRARLNALTMALAWGPKPSFPGMARYTDTASSVPWFGRNRQIPSAKKFRTTWWRQTVPRCCCPLQWPPW